MLSKLLTPENVRPVRDEIYKVLFGKRTSELLVQLRLPVECLFDLDDEYLRQHMGEIALTALDEIEEKICKMLKIVSPRGWQLLPMVKEVSVPVAEIYMAHAAGLKIDLLSGEMLEQDILSS